MILTSLKYLRFELNANLPRGGSRNELGDVLPHFASAHVELRGVHECPQHQVQSYSSGCRPTPGVIGRHLDTRETSCPPKSKLATENGGVAKARGRCTALDYES